MERMFCDVCSAELSRNQARIRRQYNRKSGKVFCSRACRTKYLFPDDVKHIGTKICKRCGEEKSKAEFYFANKKKTVYQPECKSCNKARATARNRNDPNRADILRRSVYGIEPEDVQKILENQNGLCAICFGDGDGKTLCIDHDHVTNKVRGMLCHKCNKGLGSFRDNPTFLLNAVEYLKDKHANSSSSGPTRHPAEDS